MKILPFSLMILALLVFALSLAGKHEYQEAIREEANYCKMVYNDVWPDYEGIYDEVCKKYGFDVDTEPRRN